MICDKLARAHTHTHILFKSAADTGSTCMISAGEYPAAFLAITEMLTAE